MSKQPNKPQDPSRETKRARFSQGSDAPQKAGGASPLVLVLGLVVVLAILGGAILAFTRSAPAASAAAASDAEAVSAPESAPVGSEGLLVKAATFGHDPYPPVQAADGAVRLPLATFDDYQAHFYTYMHEGKPIEFFVLKSKDGVVRAAFNACDVCFPAKKGYHQEGDEMVCNNCGNRFPAAQINEVRGGCNPSPLDRTVEGESLVIRVNDITTGQSYF